MKIINKLGEEFSWLIVEDGKVVGRFYEEWMAKKMLSGLSSQSPSSPDQSEAKMS